VTDPPPPLDREAILAALEHHQVAFVLVGGLACQAHGATRGTKDFDLCPAWDPENLEKLAGALRELKAQIKIGEGSIDLLDVRIDAKTIANMEIGTWRTAAGDVDVLLGIPRDSRFELTRFEELTANAPTLEVDKWRVPVASLQDIIRSKEIAGRTKDREALAELYALRGDHREGEGFPRSIQHERSTPTQHYEPPGRGIER